MFCLITCRGGCSATTNSVLDLQGTFPSCREVLDGCPGIVPQMFVVAGTLYELEVVGSSG
jgi:hypothetical protein